MNPLRKQEIEKAVGNPAEYPEDFPGYVIELLNEVNQLTEIIRMCMKCSSNERAEAWKKMALLLGYEVEYHKHAYHVSDEIDEAWDAARLIEDKWSEDD